MSSRTVVRAFVAVAVATAVSVGVASAAQPVKDGTYSGHWKLKTCKVAICVQTVSFDTSSSGKMVQHFMVSLIPCDFGGAVARNLSGKVTKNGTFTITYSLRNALGEQGGTLVVTGGFRAHRKETGKLTGNNKLGCRQSVGYSTEA